MSALSSGRLTHERAGAAAFDSFLPTRVHPEPMDDIPSRVYCGKFSPDGGLFVAAYQARRIRVYDSTTLGTWPLVKDVEARLLQWTITDAHISPDGQRLLYTSINPVVHVVPLGGDALSIANITEVHEALDFTPGASAVPPAGRRPNWTFGIWSCKWSPDGREMAAGTSGPNVLFLDVERRETVAKTEEHGDDVNALCYNAAPGEEGQDGNVVVSASDDTLLRIFDRRTLDASGRGAPVGFFAGHTDGLTSVSPRGDGFHFVSNSKDQTAKLWDIRAAVNTAHPSSLVFAPITWDYRWEDYPTFARGVRHPKDGSLLTFSGHNVLRTLIRAYFSPQHSTGRRYVYTGDALGNVFIYDVLTGAVKEEIEVHADTVRDLDWHPHRMMIASVGFDGRIARIEGGRGSAGARFAAEDA